jgi:ATP-dependent helicase YprA (DUF1998 family)
VPSVDHVLQNGSGRGIQAIVVYPMNAFANSHDEKLGKFLKRSSGRKTARSICPLHGTGRRSRARGDPKIPEEMLRFSPAPEPPS